MKVGIQNYPPLVIIDPQLLSNSSVEPDNLLNTQISRKYISGILVESLEMINSRLNISQEYYLFRDQQLPANDTHLIQHLMLVTKQQEQEYKHQDNNLYEAIQNISQVIQKPQKVQIDIVLVYQQTYWQDQLRIIYSNHDDDILDQYIVSQDAILKETIMVQAQFYESLWLQISVSHILTTFVSVIVPWSILNTLILNLLDIKQISAINQRNIQVSYPQLFWITIRRLYSYKKSFTLMGKKLRETKFYKFFFIMFYLSLFFITIFLISEIMISYMSRFQDKTGLENKHSFYSNRLCGLVMDNFMIQAFKDQVQIVEANSYKQLFQQQNSFKCQSIIMSQTILNYNNLDDNFLQQFKKISFKPTNYYHSYKLLFNSKMEHSMIIRYDQQIRRLVNMNIRNKKVMYSKYQKEYEQKEIDILSFKSAFGSKWVYYISFTFNLLFIICYTLCNISFIRENNDTNTIYKKLLEQKHHLKNN